MSDVLLVEPDQDVEQAPEGAGPADDLGELTAELAAGRRAARPRSAARLRLRKLVVHGFKSFADKVEFVFDRPVVGVVGPNGCGKSNVVDAVKWVLGEQSAKSLRGGAMLDVIFNGAAGRQPGSFAEVTLVFDNPADGDGVRPLTSPGDEVAVGRQLLRDGTSHYKLNGKNARLKDVRDLFLDTGVGVDAYSVIEQGRVAQMLDSSGTERRLIFEEAAGISRFKAKRKEAARRLERVDQNLLRLGDIVEEVDRRLRGVRLAAGKARNFRDLSATLADLRLASALHDYHALHARRAGLEARRGDARRQLDDVADELQRIGQKLGEGRREADALAESRRRAETALVQTRGKVEQANQRRRYAEQQLRQAEAGGQNLRRERAEAGEQHGQNAAALAADRRALETAAAALEAARRDVEARQSGSREAQLRQAEVSRQLEQTKAAVLEAMNRLAAADRRLGGIEIERDTADERGERLAARRDQIAADLAAAEEISEELRRNVADLSERILAEEETLQAKRRDAAVLGQALSDLGERLAAARESRSAIESRRKVLQDLEARREGVGAGVREVLRDRAEKFPFVRGLVADLLRVDVEHATVVEAALDGRDQWLVAATGATRRDLAGAEAALAALPERVNLLRPGCSRGVALVDGETALSAVIARGRRVRLARDLVGFDPMDANVADQLLGDTLVVESLADAVALHAAGPAGFRYVTRAGEVVEADGTLRAGPLGPTMGLLSRRSELAATAQQLDEAGRAITSLQEKIAAGGERSKRLQAEAAALRERVYELNAARVEANGRLSAGDDRANSLRREVPAVKAELADVAAKVGRLKDEADELEAEKATLDAEQGERRADIGRLAGEQRGLAESLAAANEGLTAARVGFGQVQEQQIAAKRGVEHHAGRDGELSRQIARIDAGLASLDENLQAAEREREAGEADAARQTARVGELSGQVDALTTSFDAARKAVSGDARALDAARERHDAAESAARGAEAALAELAVRLETLVSRAAEEADLDLPARYAAAEYEEPRDVDWPAVAAEIRELRAKIARLGNVNLDAIAEQEQLEGRQTTLSDQVRDLSDAKDGLEDLIDTINRESGERFGETFAAVREHFQTLFRKLFGGGRADIFLQTEVEERFKNDDGTYRTATRKVDVLEAGIEIVARPPGKQPVSISQLSGGEKTMTCVALLMSIFKSKPSPFCILDEVDAALDEANNLRFNRILEEFLGESQFIVITHSKRTMQAADVLYGVTMQEQGVSKKVAVRFIGGEVSIEK